MNISNIINQIKTNCPIINTVEGALKLMSAMESPPQGVSAYVISAGESASPNSSIGAITQRVDANFGVLIMIVFDMNDDTGAQAYTDIEVIRGQIFDALLGFVPFDGAEPIQHNSGSLSSILPGLLMWNDEFSTTYWRRKV